MLENEFALIIEEPSCALNLIEGLRLSLDRWGDAALSTSPWVSRGPRQR